jgi:hypothetical protein
VPEPAQRALSALAQRSQSAADAATRLTSRRFDAP